MKCYILEEEIEQEECDLIRQEALKSKNGRELPKKVKRIVGWKAICKSCPNYKKKN